MLPKPCAECRLHEAGRCCQVVQNADATQASRHQLLTWLGVGTDFCGCERIAIFCGARAPASGKASPACRFALFPALPEAQRVRARRMRRAHARKPARSLSPSLRLLRCWKIASLACDNGNKSLHQHAVRLSTALDEPGACCAARARRCGLSACAARARPARKGCWGQRHSRGVQKMGMRRYSS